MSRLDYLAASTWAGDAGKEHSVSETVPTTTRIPGAARGGLPPTPTPTPRASPHLHAHPRLPAVFPRLFFFSLLLKRGGRWMPRPSDIKMAVALRGNREGERKPIPNSHNFTPRTPGTGWASWVQIHPRLEPKQPPAR